MTIFVSDNFTGIDGAPPDAAKWVNGYHKNVVPPALNPTLLSNKVQVLSSGPGMGSQGVTALNLSSGGGIHVKLLQRSPESSAQVYLVLSSSGTPFTTRAHHSMFVSGGTLWVQDSGGYSGNTGISHSLVTHAYFRLQVASGLVQAYTSPTGAGGSWTAIGPARTSLITLGSCIPVLFGDNYGASTSYNLFDDFQADDDPISTAAAGGPGGTANVTFSTPDGRIFRHSATTWSALATGNIVAVGTYNVVVPNQVRLVQDGTSTPLSGFDWATIGTAAANNWTHTFSAVPQGVGTGWYNIQVRDSADPGTIWTSGKVGVGIHVLNYGQSQSTGQAETGDSSNTPTGMARVHGRQLGTALVWSSLVPSTMTGYIAADIILNAALGGKIPIAFLNMGYPGTGLVVDGPYGKWLPLPTVLYTYGKDAIAGLEGKVDVVVDIRGETDAAGSVSQATYYAGLGTLYAATRTDCANANLPIVQVILGNAGSYWNSAQGEEIKKAQVQKAADANIYRVECYDAELGGDGLHRTAAGYAEVARRWARAVSKILGLSSTYRSPRLASVSTVSPTVYDALITHEVGTDFTPTSGITGLRVTDSVLGTVLTPSSVVRQSSNIIRITLGTAPANPPMVQVAYGSLTTSNFADNSTLALPLEYTSGITAAASTTRTITLTLTTNGTTPAASLTGLKWAFFEGAMPGSFVSPADQGTAESTDGSGVLSITVNTTLGSGAVGWLIVTNSDGTTTQSPAAKAFSGPVAVA